MTRARRHRRRLMVVLVSGLACAMAPAGASGARLGRADRGGARGSASGRETPPRSVKPDKVAADVSILDGAAIGAKMREAKGHGLFVHLWASWCAPCLEELPIVDRFARAARARGATFLSISLDDVGRGAHVADVLRSRAPNLTRIVARFDDPDQFMSLFSRDWEGAIPALFGYGADGRLAASVLGEIQPDDLDRMLAGVIAPVATPRPPAPGPASAPLR